MFFFSFFAEKLLIRDSLFWEIGLEVHDAFTHIGWPKLES